MRLLRSGVASAWRGPLPLWLGLLALALSLSGCATSTAGPGAEHAARAERADMEEDGLPPQVAPRGRIRLLPDDPSEPFSRNYGRPAAPAAIPARLSHLEEEALIASAIAAHEMRRP